MVSSTDFHWLPESLISQHQVWFLSRWRMLTTLWQRTWTKVIDMKSNTPPQMRWWSNLTNRKETTRKFKRKFFHGSLRRFPLGTSSLNLQKKKPGGKKVGRVTTLDTIFALATACQSAVWLNWAGKCLGEPFNLHRISSRKDLSYPLDGLWAW